jgi:hypothetical protein
MPTKRMRVTAVCTRTVLIVAGGAGENSALATIEVLNLETSQWSTAVDLPESLHCCSATVYIVVSCTCLVALVINQYTHVQ